MARVWVQVVPSPTQRSESTASTPPREMRPSDPRLQCQPMMPITAFEDGTPLRASVCYWPHPTSLLNPPHRRLRLQPRVSVGPRTAAFTFDCNQGVSHAPPPSTTDAHRFRDHHAPPLIWTTAPRLSLRGSTSLCTDPPPLHWSHVDSDQLQFNSDRRWGPRTPMSAHCLWYYIYNDLNVQLQYLQ
jgi:hypothetical protein